MLGEFYEPVFCEISLATLYIALPICHCNEIDNSPDIPFLGVQFSSFYFSYFKKIQNIHTNTHLQEY